LADLLILGLVLIEGSTGSFLHAEHVFGFPFCNKAILVITIKVSGMPFYKIQVSKADKNIHSKQEYYLYVYRPVFLLEPH